MNDRFELGVAGAAFDVDLALRAELPHSVLGLGPFSFSKV
jgi:hypothetical protein